MIQIAARATKDIPIPSRKQARETIIVKFKEEMKALRDRLNVHSISSLLHYLINLNLEQKSSWRSKSHLRCMAGLKCERLFCGNRALD